MKTIIGILVLLSIMLLAVPVSAIGNTYCGHMNFSDIRYNVIPQNARNNDIYISSSYANPYIFSSTGMVATQTVTFTTNVCNRGRNNEYGIDIGIKDITAGTYVMYKNDAFNLPAFSCARFNTKIPIEKLPSVWGTKYWRGISSMKYFYVVEAMQNNFRADQDQNNNVWVHTLYVKAPYS